MLPDAPLLRGSVRVDESASTFHLEGGESWPAFEKFISAVPELDQAWWTPARGARRLMTGSDSRVHSGASFLQVNAGVAAELHRYVVERAMEYAPKHVIDAYSGVGDVASMLAESGVHITAVELDPDAAASCARRLPSGSRAIVGRVEEMLLELLPADVVLLNPPRAGIDPKVCAILESVRNVVRSVIYTSCDPATLARDVARLPGYRVDRVEAFDMFPQTAHVETVCELVPGDQ